MWRSWLWTETVDEKELADMTVEELEIQMQELNELCMLMQQEQEDDDWAEWERYNKHSDPVHVQTPLTIEIEEFDEKLRGIRMRSEGWSRSEDAAADAAAAEKEYQRTGIRH